MRTQADVCCIYCYMTAAKKRRNVEMVKDTENCLSVVK